MLEHVAAANALSPTAVWQTLPDDEREVLWLTCEMGLSYEDAATAMGVPVEVARACLLRARQFMLEPE